MDPPRETRDLPVALARLLEPVDGLVAIDGGLHILGVRSRLPWHDLHQVWKGERALSILYDSVFPEDVPFAANCMGDQFLLRGEAVVQLIAETGELEHVDGSLDSFLQRCAARVPEIWLGLRYLEQFEEEKGRLDPARVLLPYPLLTMAESEKGVRLAAVPVHEALDFHASIARRIEDLPDGTRVKITVKK
ncbi:MAG TPA: hypothetical protein VGK85_06995 [Myxococcaceae bacterium]